MPATFEAPSTPYEFEKIREQIEAVPGYERPDAFALGLASVEGQGSEARVVGSKLLGRSYGSSHGTAAVLAHITGQGETGLRTGQHLLTPDEVDEALRLFGSLRGEPGHDNIDLLELMALRRDGRGDNTWASHYGEESRFSNPRVPFVTAVGKWDSSPQSQGDATLRLYAMSEREREPNTINLDGVFGVLENVVETEDHGVITPERWERIRSSIVMAGLSDKVGAFVDKFPRMVDHVVPSGVRIGDADRVRLGAHLAEGTTVMHEGFVNFNAGTLGVAMVEGRISQGVIVGRFTDIGGGVSILGTLSGGGKEKLIIGDNVLLGANSTIGMSIGDKSTVAAGLTVYSGMDIIDNRPGMNGVVRKAGELSGAEQVLFVIGSKSRMLEARFNPNVNKLNESLHA